jgi:hypothetical protein
MKFTYSFILILSSIALIGSPKLNSVELKQSIPELGQYISIKDHPKAKGVNMKLKVPIGWQLSEGDRPNVVKKFVKDGNTFMILVKDNVTFFSRKEVRDLLKEDKFLKEFVGEFSSVLKSAQLIEHSVVTIDNYPALTFKVKGKVERSGIVFPVIMKCWVFLYEDKIVALQSAGFGNSNFKNLEITYSSITNSVIFPEQYN